MTNFENLCEASGEGLVGILLTGAASLLLWWTRNETWLLCFAMLGLMSFALLRNLAAAPLKIVAAPLALSSLLLSTRILEAEAVSHGTLERESSLLFGLPAFLAICLLSTRGLKSVSGTIILVASVVVLLSGLLPGEGFLVMWKALPSLLFLSLGIGISMDLAKANKSQVNGRS